MPTAHRRVRTSIANIVCSTADARGAVDVAWVLGLRAEGIVAAIGAGMNQSKMLADLVRETDVDVVMLAGR